MMIANTRQAKNIFDEIDKKGHDMDFEPCKPCQPTGTLRDTIERMMVIRERIENGEELHHPNDEILWGTDEQRAACAKYINEECDKLAEEKRAAALEKKVKHVTSHRREIKNASAKRARQRARERDKERQVTNRIRPAAFAKHPDVLES